MKVALVLDDSIDRPDGVQQWVRALGGPIRRAFVVHGEPAALGAMADILREEGVREVHVPEQGDVYDL